MVNELLSLPQSTKLLSGLSIAQLPIGLKTNLAVQASNLLKPYIEHMLQFPPNVLLTEFINTGQSVLIYDQMGLNLIGFAKNSLWSGFNEQGQPVFEFGSWVVKPGHTDHGYGHYLAKLAIKSAKDLDPNCQLIAVCASDNDKPINILKQLGAFECEKPSNVKILLGEGQAKVKFIDMTHINF